MGENGEIIRAIIFALIPILFLYYLSVWIFLLIPFIPTIICYRFLRDRIIRWIAGIGIISNLSTAPFISFKLFNTGYLPGGFSETTINDFFSAFSQLPYSDIISIIHIISWGTGLFFVVLISGLAIAVVRGLIDLDDIRL